MKSFTIKENDRGQRLDKFIKKVTINFPDSLLNKYLRLKRIKVNGRRAENRQMLELNDLVELYINDEFFPFDKDEELKFLNAPNKIQIVYEDENILLCDKPSGLVVHEDNENENDNLINRILHYLYDKGEYSPQNEASFTPALCNRIDRNTGGIVIAVKNAVSLREMNYLIREALIKKYYMCILCGVPKNEHAILKSFMLKSDDTNMVTVYDTPHPNAKTAITEYWVREVRGDYALVEVLLHTGRTHQIRAQMAYLGYPLLGDGKYGHNREDKKLGFKSQALYSYKLIIDCGEAVPHLAYLDKKEFTVPALWLKEEFEKL
ncbi:MAG: RluA family pseudouridine synthase [Oscillospiraceae bacterium]